MKINQRVYVFKEPAVAIDDLVWILDGDTSAILSVRGGNLALVVTAVEGMSVEDFNAWERSFLDSAHLKNLFPRRIMP